MSWIAGLPVALVSAAWLLLPGLLVSYGAGFRGIAAWALAPVVTIAEVASTAVVAGKLGIPWSISVVLGVCLVVAAGALVLGTLLRRRSAERRAADPPGVTLAAAAGMLPAVLLGMVIVVRGFGRPDALSQTYDAVFHYNAIAAILDSHNASSLTLGTLGNPSIPGVFYPAAWHDLASLVVLTTGTPIPVAANLMSAVIAVLGWPLSCLLLVRQVCGPSRLAAAVTGVLSVGFTAFPWGLVSFGVLWPNLLGMAIAPAVLALVLSICGLAVDDAIGRRRAWYLVPVAVLAMAFAHPNVLFSVVVLAIFPVGLALLRRAARLRAASRRTRGVGEIAVVLFGFLAAWAWAATTPLFRSVRTMYWPPVETPARAVGEVLLNATDGGSALWLLSAVMVVGIAVSWRRAELRWLIAGEALTGVLFVLTATANRPGTEWITGYWYNDSYRLAAMLPITAVPLAVLAVVFLANWLTARIPDRIRDRIAALPTVSGRLAGVAGIALVGVLVGLTRGLYASDNVALVAKHYTDPLGQPGTALVSRDERAFFARISTEIPPDAVVAGNPWDGSALLWALDGRRTLFPHVNVELSDQQKFLAANLIDLARMPKVCEYADQLHVGYLLIGDSPVWMRNPAAANYPGLADPGDRPGFRLVDSAGPVKLYRLVGCATQ